jgi:hypothetical protein
LVRQRLHLTCSLAQYITLKHFLFFQKVHASIQLACTSSRLQQEKRTVRHINVIYALTHTTIPITKCSLVSPAPKHSSAINITQRAISSASVCIKLFHNPTWYYKSMINVHIRPIHFCVSCTHLIHGVCIDRMKGTHEGIYTVWWGPVFSCLVRDRY